MSLCGGGNEKSAEWLDELAAMAADEGRVSAALSTYFEAMAGNGTFPISPEEAVEGLPEALRTYALEQIQTLEVLLTPEVMKEIHEGILD